MNLGKTLLPLLAVLAVQTAGATIRTVTNLNDSGKGSLRDAIAASAENDTINFGVPGVIYLTTGELVISHNLAILGSGPASIELDGNRSSRVFTVYPFTTVNISNLKIGGGVSTEANGGAIENSGTLTLNNCLLSYNETYHGQGG